MNSLAFRDPRSGLEEGMALCDPAPRHKTGGGAGIATRTRLQGGSGFMRCRNKSGKPSHKAGNKLQRR